MPAIRRTGSLVLLPLLVLVMLAASLVISPTSDAARMSRGERIKLGMRITVDQKGDPYRYGAAGPDAFDCSGLIYYSYRKAGFDRIPRTSDAQSRYFRRISKSNMRRGDFVFFYRGGDVYHMGVFAGRENGRAYIVHAPYGNNRVRRDPIWTDAWFGGTLRR